MSQSTMSIRDHSRAGCGGIKPTSDLFQSAVIASRRAFWATIFVSLHDRNVDINVFISPVGQGGKARGRRGSEADMVYD